MIDDLNRCTGDVQSHLQSTQFIYWLLMYTSYYPIRPISSVVYRRRPSMTTCVNTVVTYSCVSQLLSSIDIRIPLWLCLLQCSHGWFAVLVYLYEYNSWKCVETEGNVSNINILQCFVYGLRKLIDKHIMRAYLHTGNMHRTPPHFEPRPTLSPTPTPTSRVVFSNTFHINAMSVLLTFKKYIFHLRRSTYQQLV